MAGTAPLRFGIEIEALFAPLIKNTSMVLFEFGDFLAVGHSDMYSSFNDWDLHTDKWEVSTDASVRGDEKHGPCEQRFRPSSAAPKLV